MIRKVSAKVFSFPVMLAGVLASWVFVGASKALWDPDVWFHMRNAAYLLSHGGRPIQADLYSYTAHGLPLVDHQWLSELPYYYAWRAAGWWVFSFSFSSCWWRFTSACTTVPGVKAGT